MSNRNTRIFPHMLAQYISSRFTSAGLSRSWFTLTNVHAPKTKWKQLEAYGVQCPLDMQHCFRDILAEAPVLACFHSRFQEFVRHHFICFYLMIACSAPFTIRLWHFYGSKWLHFFSFFFKVGHVKHECVGSTHQEGLVYLSSGTQHLIPLLCMPSSHHIHWVLPAHPALLQREREMEGKGFFLRIIGNLWEGPTERSTEPGTLVLLIHDWCMAQPDTSPTWQPQ